LGRLTCREVILEYLDEYVDGTLGPEMFEDFERHLAICPPCVAYLNTYRRTRELAGRMGRTAMPTEMRTQLQQYLLARLTTPERAAD
jgi:anti-sigma factor RsiW